MLRMQLIVIFVILRSLAHCASINTDHTVQPPNQNAASQSQSNTVHINPIPAGRRRSYPSNRSREYLTDAERVIARRRYRSKYQSQFTGKNIELAKKTLTGTDLQNFLKRADRFREKKRQHTREWYKNRKSVATQGKPDKAQQKNPVQQKNKAPKRKMKDVSPPKTEENTKKARKTPTYSSILMREADIRAANKAAWSQLN